jgi:hypothetical protein
MAPKLEERAMEAAGGAVSAKGLATDRRDRRDGASRGHPMQRKIGLDFGNAAEYMERGHHDPHRRRPSM